MSGSADTPAIERHEGGCLCGRVRYAFSGNPLVTAVCHCTNCRRQSGSAFSVNCVVEAGSYRQTGETRIFLDRGESGLEVRRHFCADCGSPIVSIAEGLPGLTIVKAGSLDAPARWPPQLEAYCDTGLPWMPALAWDRHARSNLKDR